MNAEGKRALVLGGTVMNLNRWARVTPIWELSPAWEEYGLAIGEAMGLRHFGIDLRGVALDEDPHAAAVIEVNASPLLLRMFEMGYSDRALEAQGKVLTAAFEATARLRRASSRASPTRG